MKSRPHHFVVTNTKEIYKLLELYEMIDKYQPLGFRKARVELNAFQHNIHRLSKKEQLPMDLMVRLASLLNMNLLTPTFLFDLMMQSPYSFSDVEPLRLSKLVEQILFRIN